MVKSSTLENKKRKSGWTQARQPGEHAGSEAVETEVFFGGVGWLKADTEVFVGRATRRGLGGSRVSGTWSKPLSKVSGAPSAVTEH